MSKLSEKEKFFDLSDYGRPIAKLIAEGFKTTKITPVQVTYMFGVCGLLAIYCILAGHFYFASFFLVCKSILDAADGELARIKQTPSYTGRYLDSVFDSILNFMILMAIASVAQANIWLALSAYACMQLQGTVYNYYYVILRNNTEGGDTTSKIFETKAPVAFPTEKQQTVNILFGMYRFLYAIYDQLVYKLDRKAFDIIGFPSWFMTIVSMYGLGFQLLIIAIMLSLGYIVYIIPFFIFYTVFIILIIGIRKLFVLERG